MGFRVSNWLGLGALLVVISGAAFSCSSAEDPPGSSGGAGKKNGAGRAGAGGSSGASGSAGGLVTNPFPSGSLGGSAGNPGGSGAGGQGGNSLGAGGSSSSGFGGGNIFGGSGGEGGAGSGGSGQGGTGGSGGSGQSGSGGSGQGGTGGSGGSGQGGSGGSGQGGTGGSGGSGQGGAGGSPCTPDCTGRQCGLDPTGCGVSCGQCGPESQCTAQGVCQEVCKETWITTVNGMTGIGQTRLVDGKAYAVGHKSGVPWVGYFSGCTGALQKQVSAPIPGSLSSSLLGLNFVNGVFHVVGSVAYPNDSGDGLYLRMDPSLNVLFATPLFGSSGLDELWASTQTPSGDLWMAGTALALSESNVPWMVKGPAGGQNYCGFSGAGAPGVGRSVASLGGSVWIGGVTDGHGYLGRFADGSCGADDPCGCAPQGMIPLKLGQTSTEIRSLLAWQGTLYVAGFGNDSGNLFGFVARVSPQAQAVEGVYRWDPTGNIDVLLDLATDGSRLFVTGAQGWKGEQDLSSAQGVLMALPLGFSSSSVPDWNRVLPAARIFLGVSTAAGGVVAWGAISGNGVMVRCTTDGKCP